MRHGADEGLCLGEVVVVLVNGRRRAANGTRVGVSRTRTRVGSPSCSYPKVEYQKASIITYLLYGIIHFPPRIESFEQLDDQQ